MALVEVKVPDIGDFKEVTVIELLVKAGDSITAEQSLLTVESDKASMEIPSSHAGVVKELKVKIGDTVNQGSLLLLVLRHSALQCLNRCCTGQQVRKTRTRKRKRQQETRRRRQRRRRRRETPT